MTVTLHSLPLSCAVDGASGGIVACTYVSWTILTLSPMTYSQLEYTLYLMMPTVRNATDER